MPWPSTKKAGFPGMNCAARFVSRFCTSWLTITAFDSRNNSKSAYKDIAIIPYSSPAITASITRLNSFEEQTTLKIAGSFAPVMVGNAMKNGIVASSSVKYRIKEAGTATWGAWTTVVASVTDTKFSTPDIIMLLDNSKQFDVQISLDDKFETSQVNLILNVGQPVLFVGKKGMVGVNKIAEKPLDVNGDINFDGDLYRYGQKVKMGGITSDTTNNQHWTRIGNIQIISGYSSVANGGTTITFAKPFIAAPHVVCTVKDPSNQTAWVYAISATNTVLKQIYTPAALTVSWIAVGRWSNDNSEVGGIGSLNLVGGIGSVSAQECPYGIGDIYLTTKKENPSSIWFDTAWESFGVGRTLVGVDASQAEFNDVGKTGGAKTHTLTVSQMPSHSHEFRDGNRYTADGNWDTGQIYAPRPTTSSPRVWARNGTPGILYEGGGGAHNNLQPFITCYIWRRVS